MTTGTRAAASTAGAVPASGTSTVTEQPSGQRLFRHISRKVCRTAVLLALVTGPFAAVPVPASAASGQITGGASYVTSVTCPGYGDFDSYPPLLLTGSLEGCLYTKVAAAKTTPSGAYLESGQEVFVGSLDGGSEGTFTTTYRFEAKYDPDGAEIHGRCQHPIVRGSGTGGLQGAIGRLDIKDIIGTAMVTYEYRGHVSL